MVHTEKSAFQESEVKSAWTFADMEAVWKEFKPLTPYGKDYWHARILHTDSAILRTIYDDTKQMAKFHTSLKDSSSDQEKLAWHLARIPRLPAALDDVLDVFIVKKFLANYRALGNVLDEKSRERFGYVFFSDSLFDELNKGGSDSETFFIASSYDSELETIRAKIREISEKLTVEKKETEERITRLWGIDFRNREFLTVPVELAMKISAQAGKPGYPPVAVESYDDSYCLIRPLPDEVALELELLHAKLREQEAQRERAVLQRLFEKIRGEQENLSRYARIVERIDLARARYLLEKKYSLRKPDLAASIMEIWEGRFIPLKEACISAGRTYTPLNMHSEKPVAVLFGSNMGGKTIVLRTIVFLQLMAQTGLGVPAEVFKSRIYSSIRYVGDNGQDLQKGLSGFGMEIHALNDIIETARHGACLCAFDEFAHSTSSDEAEALLSAVIMWFARNPANKMLFATHFRQIARIDQAQYYSMAGLDILRAEQAIHESAVSDPLAQDTTLIERIRKINEMMRYVVRLEKAEPNTTGGSCGMLLPAASHTNSSDALAVASLLGLEPEIVQSAAKILQEKHT